MSGRGAKAAALVRAWLWIDFFGATRRSGEPGSTLTSTIFTQSFVGLVVAALTFDSRVGAVAYAAANLSLSTVLVGAAALADPQSTQRRLADRVLVGTAPVERSLLPLARALHGGFHLGLVTVGVAIPPAILCGFVTGDPLWTVPAYLLLAVLLAGGLSATASLVVRVTAAVLGETRAALVAGTGKALLLGGALVAFALCLPLLDETAAALPFGGAAAARLWPPYLGARFLVAPWTDLVYGLALLGAVLVLALATVAFGDPEPQGPGRPLRPPRASPLGWLERRCAGGGALLGTTVWTSTMLFRSGSFRARVLPLFGIPFAMVLLSFGEQGIDERTLLLGVTLQLPSIYLPFVVAFLPHADHEGAAWLFDTSPHDATVLAREAALLALAFRILLPVQLVAGASVALLGFGSLLALSLATFSWAVGVAVAAWSVRQLDDVPFTADRSAPPVLGFGGLVGLALALAAAGGVFAWQATSPAGLALAGTAVAAAAFHLGRAGRRTRREAA